jgi:hypothetical protein
MTWHLVQIELRRRVGTVLLVAALVALVTGVVLASVAGARRTETAYDRYEASIGPADALAFGEDPSGVERLRAVPFVDEVITMDSPAAFPADGGYLALAVPEDTRIPDERLRFPVVEGRRPDPGQPFEVALSERTASQAGVRVGDRIAMESMSANALAKLNDDVNPV